MAGKVIKSAVVTIGGQDISAYVRQVTLDPGADAQETTTMGSNTRTRIGGLKSWSANVEVFIEPTLDAILWPLLGTSVAVTIKHENAAVSVSNPLFSGSAILTKYNPVQGSVGDVMVTGIELQGSGDLTRATA